MRRLSASKRAFASRFVMSRPGDRIVRVIR
jgi:hypothetical protein